jgi:hypothetical protein
MMGRWRIEKSSDGALWEEIISFFNGPIAQGVFDVELVFEKHRFIRLVRPDGTVEERAAFPDRAPRSR